MTIVVLSVLIIQLMASPQGRPWSEQYRDEAAAANRACDAKKFMECRANLLLLKELLDGRADIIYRLGTVEASLGNRTAAIEWLSLYSKMGLHLIAPPSDAPFSSFNDSAEFQAVMVRLVRNAAPVTTSRLFAKPPENDLITEDITYDSARMRFYVSSVRHRKLLSLTADGTVSDFIADAEWPILALEVDSRQRILWATTVALPEGLGYNPADEGKLAVPKFNLDSGKPMKRYDLPPGMKHELGDLTVSNNGDVYASDGLVSVYKLDYMRDELELLFGSGTFRSPQTPALSPSGRRMFLPGYSRGITIVDLPSKTCELLSIHQTYRLQLRSPGIETCSKES